MRAIDPHPDVEGLTISDQVGDSLIGGPCSWCGGQILPGTRIRRLERELGGEREVTKFCTDCIAAMAGVEAHGTEAIEARRKLRRAR